MNQNTMQEPHCTSALHHCKHCRLAALCLPLMLNEKDLQLLEKIIEQAPPLEKGTYLLRQGEPFKSIYAVRSGSLKSYAVCANGNEQITGFHFPGEMLGVSGLVSGQQTVSVQALETTAICEIPYEHLDQLSGRLPQLRRQLMVAVSREICEHQQMMVLLSQKTADEKLATFLHNLSLRFHQRGYSAAHFRLSMSRQDIANFLGLAMETVSRIFTRFQHQGLIQVDGKEVHLLKPAEISALAKGADCYAQAD